ncbi:MAG: Smr/MutS family protein [Bacilli bacterium]|nr:Smr/MutS family protein [Bacilli bacterium]
MQDIYVTFEFNKIKEMINEYTKTSLGYKKVDSLSMLSSFNEVNEALEDLKEMTSIIFRFGPLPIENSVDALEMIEMAKKTGILTPHDFHMIDNDILTMLSLNEYIKKIDVSYPRIQLKIASFKDLSNLQRAIRRVITNALTVDDKASQRLSEIRSDLKKLSRQLESKAASLAYQYSAFLSDENPTIRDGHFVLPVKTAYKSKVIGAIYDVSDTGNTTFIEPLEIITLNNQITGLKVEEAEEVRRILKELTSLLLLQEDEVINNNKIIGELDFLSAKALFGKEINGEIASLSQKTQVIDLKAARHPLLDPNKVISNSYYFSEEKRIVIISGPNAGGKTVSLKVVGLLILMNQCGLPLPVTKATLSYFSHIYIDIGDNQSISDNLSTFSAHMSHIGEITSLAKGKDLVLIDELGTGTDPKEGEAIALGVINHLLKTHSFAFISSHFSSLKEYALTHPNIENSSMIFDEDKLLPTYIFKMGAPGRSYGLEVASRYGINKNIINEAKEYISSNHNERSDELIASLQKKVESASKIEEALKKEKLEVEMEAKRLYIDRKNLEEKREKLLSSVEKEKEKLIEETKDELNDIMKSLSNGDVKLHDVIALKKRVEELEERNELDTFKEDIKEGDQVSIPSLDLYGIVKRIKGSKATINSDSGISLEIETSRLHKVAKAEIRVVSKKKNITEINLKPVPLELNIIGMRSDEGKEKLIKYLDDCRLKHMSKVRIIHGFGSGILRKMVHTYLATQKDLTFSLADGYEGGGGATVVKFNDR